MLLWSYFLVVFTDPGSVPSNWRPVMDEERGVTDPLTAAAFPTDSENHEVRYCRKCNQLKPPRCHHCSVCGRCVLKMDHHCVWVVNCVGALNYKYFLLFLILLHSSVMERYLELQELWQQIFLPLAYEKKTTPKWRYDLGRKRNFQQVFGMDKSFWFIPAYSEEDLRRMPSLQGLEYPSKPELDSEEL